MVRPWSFSDHHLYRECPRAWWLKRVAHVPTEVDPANHRGTVMHAGLAAGYAELATGRHRAMTPGAVWQVTRQAVAEAITAKAGMMAERDADECFELVMFALESLGPQRDDRVLGVECPLSAVVDDVEIVYYADVVYRRDGVTVVRDWKSSTELPRRHELHDHRQLTLGALCTARTLGVTQLAVEFASIGRGVAVSAPVSAGTAQRSGQVVADSAHAAATDTRFSPVRGPGCVSCPVRKACPLFATGEYPVPVSA
jgi:PD-(D/E)XK nuclease superfamily protein